MKTAKVRRVASDEEELALRRCCKLQVIRFTDDGTSAICWACGSIMPAAWFAKAAAHDTLSD